MSLATHVCIFARSFTLCLLPLLMLFPYVKNFYIKLKILIVFIHKNNNKVDIIITTNYYIIKVLYVNDYYVTITSKYFKLSVN